MEVRERWVARERGGERVRVSGEGRVWKRSEGRVRVRGRESVRGGGRVKERDGVRVKVKGRGNDSWRKSESHIANDGTILLNIRHEAASQGDFSFGEMQKDRRHKYVTVSTRLMPYSIFRTLN